MLDRLIEVLESTGNAFAAGNVDHEPRPPLSPAPDGGEGAARIPSDATVVDEGDDAGEGDNSGAGVGTIGGTGTLTKRNANSPIYGADAAELRTLVHQFVLKYQV